VNRTHATMDSPLGPLTAVFEGDLLAGLYLAGQRHLPAPAAFGGPAAAGRPVAALTEQLGAYFRGELRRFDVPFAPVGTPFQQRVWSALGEVPYGTTTTYGELAADVGAPQAARAVGAANGRNPRSIVVPCHRVVGRDGTLTGYAGGLERKRLLLDLEAG
jgi:methylated-DNA-[protein]-cysteine S-methyltransferase